MEVYEVQVSTMRGAYGNVYAILGIVNRRVVSQVGVNERNEIIRLPVDYLGMRIANRFDPVDGYFYDFGAKESALTLYDTHTGHAVAQLAKPTPAHARMLANSYK